MKSHSRFGESAELSRRGVLSLAAGAAGAALIRASAAIAQPSPGSFVDRLAIQQIADRSERFMPQGRRDRKECLEWLFWQVGNLGPMAGQLSHFVNYAPGEHPYSHKRYADEYNRCLGVLEGREFILDDYSIADMASWPWVLIAKPLGQPLDEFPNVARWRETIKQRPAVQAGVDLGKDLRRSAPPTDEERRVLFNQTSRDVLGPRQ